MRWPSRAVRGTVAALARPASSGHGEPTWRGEPLVLFDGQGRPATVVLPQDDGEPALSSPVSLLVAPDLSLAAAARRAMSRPTRQRFDPLVCVGADGRILGVVAVQDLVLALTDARTAGDARGQG